MSEEVPDGRRLGLEGRAPATTAAPTIDEFCRTCRDVGQSTPADFIIWGKLFPPEALGPRCYHHAAQQIGASSMVRIDQWAVYDLRPIQALRNKVADLEVHAAKLHEALVAIAAHHADEVAFPGSPLGKVRDALTVQPPQPRQQLLGYQTSDGLLYRPEDITLVYTPDQGEAQEEYDAPIIAEPITQADRDLVRKATSTDLTGVEILPQFDRGEAQEPPRFHINDDGGGGGICTCHNCGSDATHWDPGTGWSCSNCGASDADE